MSAKPEPPLESLQHRIDAAQSHDAESAAPPSQKGMGDALRLGIELAAGIAVGVGVGLGLDKWLHTAPWLLIVCFILGCVAGFLNLKRAADHMGDQ